MTEKIDVNEISRAIYTINRHAKTALEPKFLYDLKKLAIEKLIKENKAECIGFHFSQKPRFSNQHSTLLVKVADYYFHILPTKEDFKKFEHLGAIDNSYRNPQTKMALSQAKRIVQNYLGIKEQEQKTSTNMLRKSSSYHIPSFLGQMDWSQPQAQKPKRKRVNRRSNTN